MPGAGSATLTAAPRQAEEAAIAALRREVGAFLAVEGTAGTWR
jgi:hypothetical protein